jgi:putative DNA methylase
MAVYSRYSRVLEADGSPMRVRTALALINQALDEFLAEQEGEYDADTRWALAWYEQYGFNDGPYGVAETLSKAKNTSVGGLEEAGVLVARAGKVRLLKREELSKASHPGGMSVPTTIPMAMPAGDIEWDPSLDKRPTAWEAVQYLIRALDTHGEQGAALLLSRLGGLGETARDLAYRLYTICERKGWAQDALGYNMLVVAWPRLKEMARSKRDAEQGRLL